MIGTMFEDAEVFDRGSIEERSNRLDAALYGSVAEAAECRRDPYKCDCRYYGLNFNAIMLYGTVEFRLHHGTVNVDKIKKWAAVCSAIVEYAATHSEKQVSAMKGSAFEILLRVINDKEVVTWIKARRDYFAYNKRKGAGLAAKLPVDQVALREHSEQRLGDDPTGP
jgi:hypothetical protein